jgi:hypothetical protein
MMLLMLEIIANGFKSKRLIAIDAISEDILFLLTSGKANDPDRSGNIRK